MRSLDDAVRNEWTTTPGPIPWPVVVHAAACELAASAAFIAGSRAAVSDGGRD